MIKILIIDDNKDNLISVTALLKNLEPEYEILTAQSGSEGIQLAQSEQPDTILLDVHMPKMDGYEVCQRLRADQKNNRVPIIFLTAINTTPEDKIKGLEMGGDAYLAKPIDKGELLATLHVMLRIKASEDALKYEKDLLEEKVLERTMELKELNDKYLDSYDNAPDMFVSVDTKTSTILRCNQTLVDALGYTKDEIMGQSIFFVYHSDCIKNAKKYSQQFVNTGEIHDAELQLKRKDGKKIDVSLNVSAVRDEKGNIIYSRSVWRDITERKRGEGALRESEERFRTLIKYAPLGILSIDETGKILQLNPKLLEILGSPSAETSMSINIFKFPLLQKAGVSGDFKKAIEERTSVENEVEYTSQWGKTTYIRYVLTPNFDENIDIVGAIGSFEDITERKRAEEALRESEERFRNLFEKSADAILIIKDGKFVDCNQATVDMLRFNNKEELLNTHPSVLSPDVQPDGRSSFEKADEMMNFALEKGSHRFEWDHKKSDGEVFPVEVLLTSIPTGDDDFVIHTVWRDITDRKRGEGALRESKERFRTLIKYAPLGILSIDKTGKILQVNPKLLEILDSPSTETTMSINIFKFPLLQKAGVSGDFEKAIEERTPVENEVKYTSQWGKTTFIRYVLTPNFDENNDIVGAIGSFEDISERKQAEIALDEKTMMLDNLLKSSIDVAIATTDLDFRITYYNPLAEIYFGYAVQEVIGKKVQDVHTKEKVAPERFEQAIMKVKQIGEYIYFVDQKTPGGIRHLKSRVSGIHDLEGKLTGFALFTRDITKQKQLEDKIVSERDKFDSILEDLPIGVTVIDSDDKYVYINPMTMKIDGYKADPESLIGEDMRNIHPKGTLPNIEKLLNDFKSGKKTYFSRDSKRGERSIEISYHAIHDIEGEYQGLTRLVSDITERKQASEALGKSEEKLRTLVSAITDVILVFNDEGRYIEIPQTNPSLLYKPSNEMLGKTLHEVFPVEQADIFLNKIQHTIEIQKTIEMEYCLLINDRNIWFLGKLYPMQSNLVLFVASDITERKLSEQQLHASEEKYRQLIENANEAIYVAQDGKLVFANPMVNYLLGYKNEKLFSSPFTDFIHPDDQKMVYESYVKRLKGEKVKDNYIFRIVNKNGDSKWLSIRSINIIWEGKYATLNFSTNITDRVIIDKALRESEERYRNVVDVSPYAILIHIDGKVVFANQSCGDLFGASNTDDLLDKPIIEYVHPDDRDIAIARIAEMSRSDKAVPLIEERMLRLDGKIIFVEVTATPIIHEEKQAILVILRDITERKHAAEEKAQLEQQIRESQKVESIGRLAGGIAHDFNNMLSVIIGYGDAVLNKLPQEDPLREDVEEIIKAGQRSAALTRQLLAFSRRQTLQPEVLNLNDLILNLEKMLRSVIEEHIDLELPLYKDLANVIADPGQIEQVIMNLIVNARDAMPEGGKLIIETANVELDEAYTKKHAGSTLGKFVMIAITDSGTGMDKETLEQIFEPFFTTKIKEKGTGLGLPTVYGIVKQSGGYIWVDSKPGKGTVVKIFLPQTTSQKSEKEKIDENKNLQGGGKHILIVEDEESVRSLVKDMLVSMDYKISLAANGIEALQLVKDGLKPDLILTDVIMPEMGGAELKTHILKIHPDLKVIFMSGYSDNAIGRQGEIDSTFNFIQKPFTAHDLFTKIHGVLQNEKVERPKKRILMIDDDHQFCELANRFFTRKGYNFVMVETTAAALATLTEQSIDVLLVDMNLPGTNGKLVLEAIRKAGHTAPAIILSGDLYFVNMDELRPLGAVDAIEKSSDFKPVMRMIEKIETK